MNLCRSCDLDFASVGSFDAHRVGVDEYTLTEGLRMDPPRENGRRCLSLTEMQEAGWETDKHRRWRAPGVPSDEPMVDRPSIERVIL